MKQHSHAVAKRWWVSSMLAGLAAFGISMGLAGAVGEPAPKPCKAETFAFKQVERACADGGVKAASKLMKAVQKKGKAAGEKWNCKSCHTSTKTWELTPNAVEDLRPYM